MRVAYDHQIFSWQKYGGISRYFCELATHVPESGDIETEVIAPVYFNRHLEESLSIQVVGRYFPHIPKTGRAMQILNGGAVKWLLRRRRPDVLHETYYFEKSAAPRGTRTVITIHDMIYERFPHCYRPSDKTSWLKREAVKRADHIICVSENTRHDLIELFRVERERTSVVYHGCAMPPPTASSAAPVARPYIAYVGLRGCYKNFVGLLRAYAASGFLQKNFALLCVGGGEWSRKEREEIERLRIPLANLIRLAGDDGLLADVYRHAAVFVYPSLYEGFGMPPLEAMGCGCPVVSSRGGALAEVCGTAAEYCDAEDPESIRVATERVLQSSERRDELIHAGYSRSRSFTWKTCATKTAVIYRALC